MAASSPSVSATSPLLPGNQRAENIEIDGGDDDGTPRGTRAGGQPSPGSPVRNLDVANGIAIVLGLQIGSGIFISPSLVAREAGSTPLALAIWAAAGVITWACAACYIELGTRLPYNGGAQEYLAFCFNERAGFVASWALVFTVKPCSAAILALLIATYLSDAFVLEGVVKELVSKVVAIAILLLVTVVNCVSDKLTIAVTNGLLACKTIGVVFILVMGLVDFVRRQRFTINEPREPRVFSAPSPSNVTDAMLSALWAYSGWETVGYVAGELKDPRRSIPLVTNISMLIILCLFLLANISYFTTLSFASIVASTSIGLTFSLHFFRRAGAVLYVVVICLSSLGSLNIKTFAAGRLTQAAAERQYLPSWIKTVGRDGRGDSDDDRILHAPNASMPSLWLRFWRRPVRFRDGSVPIAANIFNALLTVVYILIGNLSSLVIFIGIVEFSVAFAAILGLLRLRIFPRHSPSSSPPSLLKRGETYDSRYDQGRGECKDGAGGFTVHLVLIPLALAATGAVVSISAIRHPAQSIAFVLFCSLSAALVFPRIEKNKSPAAATVSIGDDHCNA